MDSETNVRHDTVLVVEDDETVRQLTSRVLRMNGFNVLEAADSGAALLLSEHHEGTIDLLITDVIMPRINGHELAKRLAQNRPNMAVIYMSGYTDDTEVFVEIMKSEIIYLRKPFTPDVLLAEVRKALHQPPPQNPFNA
jgi:two-component system cell cycle sensor histidine kinase/response regulator CckA